MNTILAAFSQSTTEALVLAIINIVNLIVSAYNTRKIAKVRAEQKQVAAALTANGTSSHSPRFR